MLNSITLLHPLFLLLIPLYILCQFFCKARVERVVFSNFSLLKQIGANNFNLKKVLKILIAIFLILALSEPVFTKVKIKNIKNGIDIALALDVSVSMSNNQKFTIAKKTLIDFIKKRDSDNIALSVFANRVLIASSLTNNTQALVSSLKFLKLGVAGSRDTALYEALYQSVNLLKNSKAKSRVVVLLTDGINTIKRVPLYIAILKAKKYGVRVYTIGVGDKGDFNKKELKSIAKSLNGKFFSTDNPKDLKNIYYQIDKLEKSKIVKKREVYYKELFIYPLSIAIILLILLIFIERKITRVLLLLTVFLAFSSLFYKNRTIITKEAKNGIAIAFECSKSIYVDDLYPNRFSFAKTKILKFIKDINIPVSLFVFNDKTYLLSSETLDKSVSSYLLKRLSCKNIEPNEGNILKFLKSLKLLGIKKALIVTPTSNKKDYFKEKEFIEKNNLDISIYAVATKTGGIAKRDNKILTDKNGEMFYAYLNENIKDIANNGFVEYSLDNQDINNLLSIFSKKDIKIFKVSFNFLLIGAFFIFLIASFDIGFRK